MRALLHCLVASWFSLAAGAAASPGIGATAVEISAGQTVYASVYSQVQHGNLWRSHNPPEVTLSAMLSVRNVDPNQNFRLTSVKFFDSRGRLLRELLPEPRIIDPMASVQFFVENRDLTGGPGANFLVAWSAEQPINAPIIETVHAYFFGTQSIAFVTPGRPIRAD